MVIDCHDITSVEYVGAGVELHLASQGEHVHGAPQRIASENANNPGIAGAGLE